MKIGIYISKESYEVISDFVVSSIVRLVNKPDKTDEDIKELEELNNARKELNEWAEEHNNLVLDSMPRPTTEQGKGPEGK